MVVMFRGKPACECLATWLPAYEAELLRRGVIRYSIDIYQLIGTAKASAGTHIPGGAYDVAQVSEEAILVAREMGAAAWHRPPGWDGGTGIEHQHGVLRGCPHNAGGRYQIAALDAGYNGLGRGGEGGRDIGPTVTVKRTWQQGIEWARKQARPTRISAFLAGGPRYDMLLLDAAVAGGRHGVVKQVRDGIDAQVRRLPRDRNPNTRVRRFLAAYRQRDLRLGLLTQAVATGGRQGTVRDVRDEIRRLIESLPAR